MYTTSYFTRVIAFCLFFTLSSNILGGSYVSYVLADELSGSLQSTGELISVEDDIVAPILAGDILTGSQEKTVDVEIPVVESTGSTIVLVDTGATVVIVDTGATISVESGSIDSSSGVILVSTGGITSTGSSLSPESPIADLSSFCTGTTDTVIEIANEATTKIVKDYIENIDTKDLDTVTASGTDKEISQQLKETILDGYMDGTEKTKLTQDQMNSNLSISENEVTTILRDAIMDKGSDDIHLFIKTDLNIGKLQELFVFFDSTGSYLFNEQYIDPVDSLTVYEMIFSRDSTFGKRIVDYLYAGVVPDNFFDQIQIIRPGLIYGLADTGYLSGETSSLNWGIPKIKANLYQSLFVGKPRIKIGVIDTGVDINHPDLAANIYTNPAEIAGNRLDDDNNGYIDDVHGYSFVYNTGVVTDVHSHGTHVAGIIGAAVNGRGIYGVYSQALIVPLKALGDTGNGSTYGISNAIRYAADNGISVINMSLGGAGTPNQNDILCAAITYARSKGTLSVVSAGNSNINITGFSPSGCQDAIAVGAVDSNLAKASFSNYGTGVLVSAPGVSIYSTIPGGGYIQKSGTSMAAPFVAGAIGAIFAMKGTMDLNQVRDILSKNGDTITTTAPMGVSLNLDKIFLSLGISSNLSNPVITLSGASTMNIALGSVFVDPGATCRDDIDLTCTVTKSGTVNTSLSGTYLITYGAVDNSGNLAIPLTRTVRVSDLTPPVITLSGASPMNVTLGSVFVDPGATCRDNYDLTCVVTKTGTVNTSLSGAYIITYSARDSSGNNAIDILRTVRVSDLTPPVITLSGASTMSITLGSVFVDPGATCRDNYDLTCTVTKSGTVNTSILGTYFIVYRAVDSSGNSAISFTRTVQIIDITPPVIALSGASTMSIALGSVFVDPGATCRDNYDITCTVTKTGTVNTSLSGNYLITYRAVDTSGNIAGVVSRTVSVYPVAAVAPTPITTPSSPGLGGGGGSYGGSPVAQPVVTKPVVTQPVVPPVVPALPKGFVINKELLQRFNIRLPILPVKKIVSTLPKIQSGSIKEFVEKVGIYGTVYNTSDLIVRSAKNTTSAQVSQKLNRGDRLYVSTRDQNGWSFIKTTTGEWGYVRSHYIHLQDSSK